LKEYTYALIYNDPKLKDEWMEKQKESCDKWEYDMKGGKFITYHDCTYPVRGKEMLVWYMIKPQPMEQYWVHRYAGIQFYSVYFLDGEFKAFDIMYLLNSVRGGVRDV
jgi:hypothetical protein